MRKSKMKKVVATSIITTSIIVNSVSPVVSVFADDIVKNISIDLENRGAKNNIQSKINMDIAQVSKFELYDNVEYNKSFKLDNALIQSVKSNSTQNNISNITDDNMQTFWSTNKLNTDNFKNEIEVTFKEIVKLDRVVYGGKPAWFKGFAQEVEIFASASDNGDDFKLVTTGYSPDSKDLVEIKFEATEFKRLKFKFKKSYENHAQLRELVFYKEDKLSEIVTDMFIDKTMITLKEEYRNIDIINKLQEQVNTHPLKENLQTFINRAYKSLNNDFGQEQVKLTLPQIGNIHKGAKDNLLFNSYGTNFIGTGVVATPGEIVEVYVDINDGDPLPSIMFTQSQGHYGKWQKTYNLKPGYNKFVVPEIYDAKWEHKTNKGGAIYLVNPYTDKQQSKAPVVVIEGGRKFPTYKEGDDKAEFLRELKDYKKYMDENPDTAVDIFEYDSKRVLFTGTSSDAYTVYIDEGVDLDKSINVWSDFTEKSFEFMGLSDDSKDIRHNSKNMKTSIRVMQPHGAAYAAGNHVGIQKHVADDFLRIDKKNVNGIIWGTMHEIGHQVDIPARTWGEVTNNMIANEMAILNEKGCRLNYNRLYSSIALNHNKDKVVFENIDLGDRLAMFWQLEVYKDGYWAQIERMYRERRPSPADYQEKKDIFALYASEIIGQNLTEYFERYGFTLSEKCKNELSKLPKLDKKIWYIHSDAMKYEGQGFTNEALPTIKNIKADIQTNTNTIEFEIDEKNKENILGYEIYRDGEVVGFTRNTNFVDSNIDTTKNHTYEVVAYDMKLNTSKKAISDSHKPNISVKNDIFVQINKEFNPLEYVSAVSYKGDDLTNTLVIKENNVDTSKRGTYHVTYELTHSGITISQKVEVKVVSNFDYASDINYTIKQSGWNGIRNDKAPAGGKISVLVDGVETSFEKGIGAHANSEISFDIEGKNYTYFNAVIGIDKNVRNKNNPSAKYKVLADGVEIFASKEFRANTNSQKLSIQIPKNTKKLTLITDQSNGSWSEDQTVWADAKFVAEDSKPSISGVKEQQVVEANTKFDLLKGVTASDIEDGDLTENIVIEDGGFNINKPGTYEVTYTVKDSDNNIETKISKIVVYKEMEYASNKNYTIQKSGWGGIKKDKAPAGGAITVLLDGKETVFEKGIGAHTNSQITFNVENEDYGYFSAILGIDINVRQQSRPSAKYIVMADDNIIFESKEFNAKTPAQEIVLEIPKNTKEVKLITDDSNGNWSEDQSVWADAKFIKNKKEFNYTQLNELIKNANELYEISYTKESWNNLQKALDNATQLVENAISQEQVDNEIVKLQEAIDKLEGFVVNISDEFLIEEIKRELNLTTNTITTLDMLKLKSLTCESYAVRSLNGLEYAKNLETLDISYNEVSDLSPLAILEKLTEFEGSENFMLVSDSNTLEDGNYIIDNAVIDIDGQKIIPSKVVLSPNSNPIELNIDEVIKDGKIVLDKSLVQDAKSVEIEYKSKTLNYSLYVLNFL